MRALSRRLALKLMGFGSALMGVGRTSNAAQGTSPVNAPTIVGPWNKSHDRIWLSGDCWANPMEDWRIVDGAAECQTTGGNRNIQLITRELTNAAGSFEMSVEVTQLDARRQDGGVGFRIGVRSDIAEYRSNSFAGGGVSAGLINGKLMLGRKRVAIEGVAKPDEINLRLQGTRKGEQCSLQLTATNAAGNELGVAKQNVPADSVLGNVALVNNFDAKLKKGQGSRYRFRNWSVSGDAFSVNPERKFGPILWSMYSLSDSRSDEGFVLKISALTGPLGEDDSKKVELQIKTDGPWKSFGDAELDADAWTATFRIPNWNEKAAAQYKLVYREQHTEGPQTVDEWAGTIKANPAGRPLRLGALTCQNDYGFPYEPVANNVVKLDPDMLYFSGDQLYESHGGFGLIRDPAEPAILNYLRKFYMFGWAFRDAMRDRPTICIADDHDVFQGNIWGEGGEKMTEGSTSSKGGYREPARMVNVVHRTCTSHHPDYFDPTPVKQDISVYFGDMVYGGVSFAILGDRQFKSGPERVETGSGRADHVKDQNVDTAFLDKPGLVLLGERQEAFLRHWVDDWRGHSMKVLLSQTVFAGVATHHGGYDGYLKADLDSGGWPQTARDNAIRIISKGMPLHINGDQHLTTLVQYGVDKQRDSCWSFCTPAIAAGYPRWWRPDEMGMPHENRPVHGLPNTGEYLDGFGNRAYVFAVGNPEVGTKKNRYEKAHQKGSGFGLVTIDTEAKTYTLDAFRFLSDPTDDAEGNQFPGWPVTIYQRENAGDNVIG
ncbi:MAG: alkaline phosphatase D family protein [Planctomycetes bacterium]|nr:alkaline phosphatase D family protein [Planctomycetota bacterium]